MRGMRLGSVALAALLIAACSQDDVAPEDSVTTQMPARNVQEVAAEEAMDVAAGAEIGTPMEERVATLGLLNKRTQRVAVDARDRNVGAQTVNDQQTDGEENALA